MTDEKKESGPNARLAPTIDTIGCSCSVDDPDEFCPYHGRVDFLRAELAEHRREHDDRAEAGHRAAQALLRMMWIYPNYNVKSRGPIGCIHDALRLIDPDMQERLENGEEPRDLMDPDPEDEPAAPVVHRDAKPENIPQSADSSGLESGDSDRDAERDNVVAFLLNRAEWLRQECLNGGTCDVEQQQAGAIAGMIAKGRHRDRASWALPNWQPASPVSSAGDTKERP